MAWHKVTSQIAQKAVLGTILFNAFTNNPGLQYVSMLMKSALNMKMSTIQIRTGYNTVTL